jgi:hypothetical protein
MQLLHEAVEDQFSPEGVHLQYSFNYQRMVLQLLFWTLSLAQLHDVKIPASIIGHAAKGLRFVGSLVDPISGHAPNYGSNDGSLILPLATCEYGDYRPLLQMGSHVLSGKPALESGPWDEAGIWICSGNRGFGEEIEEPRLDESGLGGFHRLGDHRSWAMVRAGRYVRRPFQADQLHVDIWHDGINLARDAGKYLYNGAAPWDNGLARTQVHNTVTIDCQDQMQKAGRFLWVDWAQASGKSFTARGDRYPSKFEGEHDGYRRIGVEHRREVHSVKSAGWVVLDDIFGNGEHEVAVQWLVPDGAVEVPESRALRASLQIGEARFGWLVTCVQGGTGTVTRRGETVNGMASRDMELLGWESPTYGERRPSISLRFSVRAQLPLRLITVISIGEVETPSTEKEMTLKHNGSEAFRASLFPENLRRATYSSNR